MKQRTANIFEPLVLEKRLDDVQHRGELREYDRLLAFSAILDRLHELKDLADLRGRGREIGAREPLAPRLEVQGLAVRAAGRLISNILGCDAVESQVLAPS